MDCLGRDVIPVTWPIMLFLSVHNKDEFASGDYSKIVSVVVVRQNFCSGRVTGEENVAILGGEFMGIEGTVEFG